MNEPRDEDPPAIPTIDLRYGVEDAVALSHALSDVLCWIRGFNAKGEGEGPTGVEVLRTVNIHLKRRLSRAGIIGFGDPK